MATNKKKTVKKSAKPTVKKSAPAKAAKKSAPAKSAKSAPKLALVKTPPGLKLQKFLTPLEDRILVRIENAPQKTAGGLFIPGNAGERPDRGEVVAAGPGRRNKKGKLRPLDVAVGDQVLFAAYSGAKITIDGTEVLILREDEVLGIVT